MTKELEQIAEMIDGKKRYKLFDPARKAVLALPNAAFKLWVTYWTFEQDGKSYPSMEKLVKLTGMTERTIQTARKYLIKTGWLIKLKGSAAEYYTKASRGSYKIEVYRVDDPSKLEGYPANINPLNLTPQKLPLTVGVGFVVDVVVDTVHGPLTMGHGRCLPSATQTTENQNQNQKPPARTAPPEPSTLPAIVSATAPVVASPTRSTTKWLAKYDVPRPADFDTWSVKTKAEWVEDHRLVKTEIKPAQHKQKSGAVESKFLKLLDDGYEEIGWDD